jgi:hypothetical protein
MQSDEIFADLVALLPEPHRQRELEAVHQQRKDRPSDFPEIAPNVRSVCMLRTCSHWYSCRQVVHANSSKSASNWINSCTLYAAVFWPIDVNMGQANTNSSAKLSRIAIECQATTGHFQRPCSQQRQYVVCHWSGTSTTEIIITKCMEYKCS